MPSPRPRHHDDDVAAPAAPDVVGVVLAGGANSRFGGPKGLERVGGRRIVDRVVAALAAVTPDLLLVANAPEAAGWLPGVPIVGDAIPGGGGLSGVHAALAHAQRPIVAVAWDMPFVTGALLGALARKRAEESTDACFAESPSPVGLEPFCACYAPGCLAPLAAALAAGNCGGAQFARSLARVSWIRNRELAAFGDPGRLFLSVNTVADLARADAMCTGTV